MMTFAVHLLGLSSILGAIDVITTILNMRAPGMTLMRMPTIDEPRVVKLSRLR